MRSDTAPLHAAQQSRSRTHSPRSSPAGVPEAPIATDGQPDPALHIRVRSWRAVRRGALRGYADVELPSLGLVLCSVAVFVGSTGNARASLPGKPKLDREGRQRRENGRPVFEPVAFWQRRAIGDAFSAAVISALRTRDPRAL
jgi:hypothetical protein